MDTPKIKFGPHKAKPVPEGAALISSNQFCNRYGGKSKMWLWRKIKTDPGFPQPVYLGRYQFFRLADVEAYEATLTTEPDTQTVSRISGGRAA